MILNLSHRTMYALLWLDIICFCFLSKVIYVKGMSGMFRTTLMR